MQVHTLKAITCLASWHPWYHQLHVLLLSPLTVIKVILGGTTVTQPSSSPHFLEPSHHSSFHFLYHHIIILPVSNFTTPFFYPVNWSIFVLSVWKTQKNQFTKQTGATTIIRFTFKTSRITFYEIGKRNL